jgi:hypothetical protein
VGNGDGCNSFWEIGVIGVLVGISDGVLIAMLDLF